MNRRHFSQRLALTAAAAAAGLPFLGGRAFAQGAAPVEGQDYKRLSQPAPFPDTKGKVDVVEFFSFACPHCAEFEPVLEAWLPHGPAEMRFRRVPVPFLFNPENLQPMWFTLEALNLEALAGKVFDAIHKEHVRFTSPAEIAAFAQKNGQDPKKFMDTFNSFGVKAKVNQAKAQVAAYGVNSVPMLAVGGRFLTSPADAHGLQQVLQVVDSLVKQVAHGK